MLTRRKVFAYITHGQRLLVFRHPFVPEAGLQVPAGTVEPGESPEAAVLREAREETGLSGLELVSFLGEQIRSMVDFGLQEAHHRYFYHLVARGELPIIWRHGEMYPSDGTSEPIIFEFFWADLSHQFPSLIADHDRFIPELRQRIKLESLNEHFTN
jgi:8-oxo-dGTP pyrophosphatase MutT (NUDIX family)